MCAEGLGPLEICAVVFPRGVCGRSVYRDVTHRLKVGDSLRPGALSCRFPALVPIRVLVILHHAPACKDYSLSRPSSGARFW